MTTTAPAPADWREYYTDPYPGRPGVERIEESCGKCLGTGLYLAPTHVVDGAGRPFCFGCQGTGIYSRLVSSARQTSRAAAKRRAEAVNTAREAAARRVQFETAHPGLRDRLTDAHYSLRSGHPIRAQLGYLLDDLESIAGTLTTEQVDQAESLLELLEQERLQRRPVPAGRVAVTGEVLTIKPVESEWGTTLKAVIRGAGWRVYGTLPSGLTGAHRGDVVEFTATVNPSDDDDSFGFYRRPTKARFVERIAPLSEEDPA